jgi:hypothetical protein
LLHLHDCYQCWRGARHSYCARGQMLQSMNCLCCHEDVAHVFCVLRRGYVERYVLKSRA